MVWSVTHLLVTAEKVFIIRDISGYATRMSAAWELLFHMGGERKKEVALVLAEKEGPCLMTRRDSAWHLLFAFNTFNTLPWRRCLVFCGRVKSLVETEKVFHSSGSKIKKVQLQKCPFVTISSIPLPSDGYHLRYHIKLHFFKTVYEDGLLAVYRHVLLAYINFRPHCVNQ